MSKTDLVLLHAPSVYDFRKRNSMYGPISDVIPSGPVFEMYPIGFLTILGYLQQHGFSVRIINLAYRMLQSKRFDAEKLIRSLNPLAFGIDLHWLVHAHGSLEIASIVKKYHPDTPVILGGLSSSFYHNELIKYPQIDYVLRGDSTEEPLRQLLQCIKEVKQPENVSNLTWRDKGGMVHVNSQDYSPSSLDHLPFDYMNIVRSTVKHMDIRGPVPFRNWLSYPIVAVLPWRGCNKNCVLCGGSSGSYRDLCGRKAPANRSPEMLARDIAQSARYMKAPIFILGDIRQAGEQYAERFLNAFQNVKIKNHVIVELFSPADRKFLQRIASVFPNFNLEISPESHDEEIRRKFGRTYSNIELEETIQNALMAGCRRIDIFFMTGLPLQTTQSVKETTDYCEFLLNKFKQFKPKVIPYISPLGPFVDPGSAVFNNPEKFGYHLFCKTFEDHRTALLQPSWKYMLSYETQWMTRSEIVEATYDAAFALNILKTRYGIIKPGKSRSISRRIMQSKGMVAEIDKIIMIDNRETRDVELKRRSRMLNKLSSSTICVKNQLKWPIQSIRFGIFSILRELLNPSTER